MYNWMPEILFPVPDFHCPHHIRKNSTFLFRFRVLGIHARKPGVDIDKLLISQPDNGRAGARDRRPADPIGRDRYRRDRLRGYADAQGRDGRIENGAFRPGKCLKRCAN